MTRPNVSPPRRLLLGTFAAAALSALGCNPPTTPPDTRPKLVARAVLPAATFAPGPTSGAQVGNGLVNGQMFPLVNKQPVQGFSAVLDNGDGSFLGMLDNGFGTMENSADHNLRVYRIWPDFKTRTGGRGNIFWSDYIELRDPDHKVPFTITRHFSTDRVLTGSDFDIESMQRTSDGTLWFGDEFGPFLLHTDSTGKLLEAPIPVPDLEKGGELRSPQNPFNEEASVVRVMNAARAHAQANGSFKVPVFSPNALLLVDNNPNTFVASRENPPTGSGMPKVSSEIFNVKSVQSAGYPVVVWTVDDPNQMKALLALGVNGIISDRPDLLRQAIEQFDANGDGTPGDYLEADGLVDPSKFDFQAHRGGRDLRPENTLGSMEVGLDNLATTLETDIAITSDGVPVLSHDPFLNAQKCRRADGTPYTSTDPQVLIRSLTFAQLQANWICDKLFRGPQQQNDPALSPVASAYAAKKGLISIYVVPGLQQLFDLVRDYADYYSTGAGASQADAARRAKTAARVRFNIETKLNPRAQYAARTIAPEPFVRIVAQTIIANGMAERADIQSFDHRTLLIAHQEFPQIRTVYLFDDSPVFADTSIAGSGEGTSLQPDVGQTNTAWLGGAIWPYRQNVTNHPMRVRASGGFEGMALSKDGTKLYPILEKPLSDNTTNTLVGLEFDIGSRSFTGNSFSYQLEEHGKSLPDFVMFDDSHGLVLERDDSQGDLNGFKALYQVTMKGNGQPMEKKQLADLLHLHDANQLSLAGQQDGDVGLGEDFAMPFITIESLVVLDNQHVGILNDNNYPFSIGRHLGTKQPDDTEFIQVALPEPLGTP